MIAIHNIFITRQYLEQYAEKINLNITNVMKKSVQYNNRCQHKTHNLIFVMITCILFWLICSEWNRWCDVVILSGSGLCVVFIVPGRCHWRFTIATVMLTDQVECTRTHTHTFSRQILKTRCQSQIHCNQRQWTTKTKTFEWKIW